MGGDYMFYSGDFYFDKKHSSMFNLQLVSEDSDVLREYGISFDGEEYREVTLSFCYVENDIPLSWTGDVLETVIEMFICDEYKEFISEDNEDLVFLLKGKSYVKRFTSDMKGIIDVTFDVLGSCAYRKYVKKITNVDSNFIIYNSCNMHKYYMPIIEISNISTDSVSIHNISVESAPLVVSNITSNSIKIDNMLGTILDGSGENMLLNSNRKWIKLKKGNNTFSVIGECVVTFRAYYPVMV